MEESIATKNVVVPVDLSGSSNFPNESRVEISNDQILVLPVRDDLFANSEWAATHESWASWHAGCAGKVKSES